MLEGVERSPLAVDGHLLVVRKSESLHLGDVTDGLHVSGVTAGSEDDGDFGSGVDVVGSDQGSSGVVDEGGEGNGNVLGEQREMEVGESGNVSR